MLSHSEIRYKVFKYENLSLKLLDHVCQIFHKPTINNVLICYFLCWVVIEVLIIIIKQIVFLWYDCYRRWQGKETPLRSQSFILGDTIQKLTPLPRTGMFSKNWRAILVEVAGPKAPHWMILQTSYLLWTIIHFYKTPPSKGPALYLIGEMKYSSSSSNYPFANLKSFNRTAKKVNKQLFILSPLVHRPI